MDSAPAADYADYPEFSAVQSSASSPTAPSPTASSPSVTPHQPSVSSPEPPAVSVSGLNEQITDNVPVRRVETAEPSAGGGGEPSTTSAAVESEVAAGAEKATTTSVPERAVATDEPTMLREKPEVIEAAEESTPHDNGVANEWHEILPQLKLTGMAQQLAEHCLLGSQTDGKVTLTLDNSGETLKTTRTAEALQEALGQYFSRPQQLVFEAAEAETIGETPEKRRIRLNKERQVQAESAIAEDPVILELQQKWGAVVLPGSVKPNKDRGVF